MNIAVTGATSFIGNHVIKKLIENNENRIWAIVRPGSPNRYRLPIHEHIRVVELDLMEIITLKEYIKEKIDIFYHFAWEGVRGEKRDDYELQNNNYLASLRAFEAAKMLGCRRFIGCGSQAEYGNMEGKITEEYVCNPNTEYGKAKYNTCNELGVRTAQSNIQFIWGRVFSIYGPGDYENSLIMTCINKMLRNKPVPLTACVQDWDYLYIDEAAEILSRFADCDCQSGVYNIASGHHKQLKEYVKTIKSVVKSESQLLFGEIPYPNQGMVSFIPDITKLKQELHWESVISFEEGINYIIQGWKDEKDKYCSTNI